MEVGAPEAQRDGGAAGLGTIHDVPQGPKPHCVPRGPQPHCAARRGDPEFPGPTGEGRVLGSAGWHRVGAWPWFWCQVLLALGDLLGRAGAPLGLRGPLQRSRPGGSDSQA